MCAMMRIEVHYRFISNAVDEDLVAYFLSTVSKEPKETSSLAFCNISKQTQESWQCKNLYKNFLIVDSIPERKA